jgi:hypothetical protein
MIMDGKCIVDTAKDKCKCLQGGGMAGQDILCILKQKGAPILGEKINEFRLDPSYEWTFQHPLIYGMPTIIPPRINTCSWKRK